MTDWTEDIDPSGELEILRRSKWREATDSRDLDIVGAKTAPEGTATPAADDAEVPDFGDVRAQEMAVLDYVDPALWDAAGWQGAAYFYAPGYTPTLALIFENIEYGRQIFERWRDRLGAVDNFDEIRVSIIKEVNSTLEYRILVSAELDGVRRRYQEENRAFPKQFTLLSRIYPVTPKSHDSVNAFREMATTMCGYDLCPGSGDATGVTVLRELSIRKSQIHFRKAENIGRHDPDQAALDAF